MSMNLNLLPSQAKFQAFKIKFKKKTVIFVWGLSALWFVVTLVIFGIWFFTQANYKREEKLYNREVEAYKALSDKVVLSEQIKYRAKMVGEVLSNRFEYGEAFSKINNLFSENVLIEDFKLEDKSTFSLDGMVLGSNIDEVELRIEEINNGEVDEFKSAKIKALSLDQQEWDFGMEVVLK